MAKGKKRKHPGVVLIRPEPALRIGWRARYVDPDSGKTVKESLPRELTTVEGRESWAVNKAQKLAKRRTELALGARRETGTTLADAVERYFAAHKHLRPNTLSGYRAATDRLLVWAKKTKLESADEITRAVLLELRAALIKQPKRVVVEGGKRGEHENASETRSPAAVNRDLRSLRAVLGYLSELDLLPLADGDLRRALKRLALTHEHIEYLRPNELHLLLEAALLHDADTYVETREEHAGPGRQRIGTTPKYDPIAPFVAFVLLTGCRFDEAIKLNWSQVDLDALDHEGRPVGEIRLAGADTKAKKARTIDLGVSPALRTLLAVMRPKDAKGNVFGLSRATAVAAAKRLRSEYGAPASFTWQALRRTCGTYLTNAPGIFGAASAYRSAKQLGHSVQVAEKHYLGLVRGIPPTATTLEAAMQVETELAKSIASKY